MKINLEYPFCKDYKAGYLNTNKEPRRVVLLVTEFNSKTSVSYARYLMCVKEQRYLNKNEHVDHINGNKLDDKIENLQILSVKENNIKRVKENNLESKNIKFICPICSKEFYRPLHNYKYRPNFIPTCSKKCGGIKSHQTSNQ